MDKTRYPFDWDDISWLVRVRAGHRCEICGKSPGDKTQSGYPVIVSVHHIGVPYAHDRRGSAHDKFDVRDHNLIALCQRHHLIADAEVRRIDARWQKWKPFVAQKGVGAVPATTQIWGDRGEVFRLLFRVTRARDATATVQARHVAARRAILRAREAACASTASV